MVRRGAHLSLVFEGVSQGYKESNRSCVNRSDEWNAQIDGMVSSRPGSDTLRPLLMPACDGVPPAWKSSASPQPGEA